MKSRVFSLDLARVLAILGVVAIHTENITASKTNYLGGLSWWLANTVHSLIVVSVPLFIMISGALLLNKKNLSKEYIFNKVKHQFLPPLLFWWLFYFFWNNQFIFSFSELKFLFSNFFYTEIGHLYFLQLIIGIYFVSPVIFRLIKTNKLSKSLLLLVTLVVMIYEYLSFLVFKTYNLTNLLTIFIPFTVYFVGGYYLVKIKTTVKQWWFLLLISFGLTMLISYLTFFSTKLFNHGHTLFWTPTGGNLFWEPFTLPVLLLSGIVFVLLNNLQLVFPLVFRSTMINSLLVLLSELSFGVYLIHPFVMDRLDNIFNLAIHLTTLPLWFYYLYRTSLILLVSLLLIFLLSKLKLFNVLLGIRKK